MGISETEFGKLYAMNTTASAAMRNAFREISGLRVQVKGIRGGSGLNASAVVWYGIFVDVDNIRGDAIPPVWIESPSDSQIEHVNVFRANACPKLGTQLPLVCWGHGNAGNWADQPKHNRTLVSLIRRLENVLQTQNFDSRAR
jgi:hypothetical protein